MTENLKTMDELRSHPKLNDWKDFRLAYIKHEEVLREEAIKWIQNLKLQEDESPKTFDKCNEKVISWIKMFFNISKKELEEK